MSISTNQVKDLLVKTFELDMSPEEISDDMGIVGEGLELDSVDVLEIAVQVEKQFKIKIKNQDVKPQYFKTINSLTTFINTYSQ